MSVRKAIFFDIDGTLWDWNNVIPKSTVQALYSLRKNGHLTFCAADGAGPIFRIRDCLKLVLTGWSQDVER